MLEIEFSSYPCLRFLSDCPLCLQHFLAWNPLHAYSGVICITDKRTIFVTNSDKFHSVREFSNREVIDILLDKMYKSGRLKIQTSKGNFVFSIFKYENAKKFSQIIKTHMMMP